MNQKGITLLELVVVIVVLGISLPILLIPFRQASKGIGHSGELPALEAAARYCMEKEIIAVLPNPAAWPKALTGDYQTGCIDPGNPSLNATVTGFFYDAALLVRTDGTIDNLPPPAGKDSYLVITVTATDPATGQTITLQTLKVKAL